MLAEHETSVVTDAGESGDNAAEDDLESPSTSVTKVYDSRAAMEARRLREEEAARAAARKRAEDEHHFELRFIRADAAHRARARDKEKRVEHLSQMMAKRMMNKDIVRGWTAWQSMWEEEARQRRLLKAAGQRLLKPAMSAAFANWKLDWDEEERAKLMAAARQRGSVVRCAASGCGHASPLKRPCAHLAA